MSKVSCCCLWVSVEKEWMRWKSDQEEGERTSDEFSTKTKTQLPRFVSEAEHTADVLLTVSVGFLCCWNAIINQLIHSGARGEQTDGGESVIISRLSHTRNLLVFISAEQRTLWQKRKDKKQVEATAGEFISLYFFTLQHNHQNKCYGMVRFFKPHVTLRIFCITYL